jgi:Skp family chaperone for outer membrane proteins
MNRTLVLVSAVSVGLTTAAGLAQATGVPAPAAAPATPPAAAAGAPAAVAPQAIPAKIALVAFEQAVFATNEGQKAIQDVQKKYEPKKSQIDTLASEVDSLKKQLQSAPATLSDEERQSRLKTIDTKEKQLNRDAEDAQTAYNADLQEAYGKIAQKVSVTLKNYVSQNGFTLLLDVSNQQSNVMWALPTTDITQAVVSAYNTSSGVAAPPPSAPSAAARPRPATTTPHPASTTPKQ